MHINEEQNHSKGCHIKVGWALEGAYHHPGMWDSEGWSIGGKATLVHGGNADDATGRTGYVGSTSMYVDGNIHPARFSKGDVVETYCVRHDDMVYLCFFINGRRVYRGKSAQCCSPHAYRITDLTGRCLVPAVAGGSAEGSTPFRYTLGPHRAQGGSMDAPDVKFGFAILVAPGLLGSATRTTLEGLEQFALSTLGKARCLFGVMFLSVNGHQK